MRPIWLITTYLSVVLLPLVLVWMGGHPPRSFTNELATGAGLLAYSIILVEFVLSGRFRFVSGQIGMDVTMRFHQLLARTALVLVMVHPFLYRGLFDDPKPWDTTRQLTLTTDLGGLSTGIVAWVLLACFVALSIARNHVPYKYETWRLMHGLGAFLIAGFTLHHTLSAGRYSQDPVLTSVWLVMFALAVLSLLYVYIGEPLLQAKRAWTVVSVRPLATKTWELTIKPENHPGLDFEAGQFVWLNVGKSPFSLHENPFSISSAPAEGGRLEFVIKELGDFTCSVGQIKPGTGAHIDGPHGSLTISGRDEPGIALIAGGVGIAPLLGILRQLHLERDDRPTILIYGNRTVEQIAYRDELDELAEGHGTQIVHVLSEPPDDWAGHTGRVEPKLIRETFGAPGMKDWLYVVCGPAAMMEAVENTLIDMGVSSRSILSERFDYD